MICPCADCDAASRRHRNLGPREAAIAGAWWLGMLGFALAAPAATERASNIAEDDDDMYNPTTSCNIRNPRLRGGREL